MLNFSYINTCISCGKCNCEEMLSRTVYENVSTKMQEKAVEPSERWTTHWTILHIATSNVHVAVTMKIVITSFCLEVSISWQHYLDHDGKIDKQITFTFGKMIELLNINCISWVCSSWKMLIALFLGKQILLYSSSTLCCLDRIILFKLVSPVRV